MASDGKDIQFDLDALRLHSRGGAEAARRSDPRQDARRSTGAAPSLECPLSCICLRHR